MATLPTSADISNNEVLESYPSLTWYISGDRIKGECDGYESVKQAIMIILDIDRYKWQIYSPYSGMEWENLIGQNAGYVAMETQRRIKDALMVDERITGVTNFSYTVDGDKMNFNFTVNTVYGDVSMEAQL